MRLWHQSLISKLPRQQLLGQHRECCALRGKGWGKKHRTVDYVFKHSPEKLVAYHFMVMFEMKSGAISQIPFGKIVIIAEKFLVKIVGVIPQV